ncbi:MAG: polysaccharide deacetylase family protein [Planctomycetes bacterium]|nr:polysaccharide deacetylase family protein [Planctomycetota bacterium]
MRFKRAIVRTISEISSLTSTLQAPHYGFRVLMYHAVGTHFKNDANSIYSITPELFEQQMVALINYNSASVTGFCSGQAVDGKLEIAVTFDDGYKDNLYAAAPILLKYNILFTVFVTSSFVQSNSSEFLNSRELRELSSYHGVTIGAHGVRHVQLTKCDDAVLKRELQDSKHYLEDLIGKSVTTLAYPYGMVDRRVRDAAEDAGYVRGGCSLFGINDTLRDPLLLCRSIILSQDSERVFLQKIYGDWDWCRWFKKDPINT